MGRQRGEIEERKNERGRREYGEGKKKGRDIEGATEGKRQKDRKRQQRRETEGKRWLGT
jgi:hypothetical protein